MRVLYKRTRRQRRYYRVYRLASAPPRRRVGRWWSAFEGLAKDLYSTAVVARPGGARGASNPSPGVITGTSRRWRPREPTCRRARINNSVVRFECCLSNGRVSNFNCASFLHAPVRHLAAPSASIDKSSDSRGPYSTGCIFSAFKSAVTD